MAKQKQRIDPLANISEQGFIGFVEEDESPTSVIYVQDVAIDHILDSPYQTRQKMSEAKFRQLVHSIQELGFQGYIPVRIHPQREGYYQIVAGGHSRRDAAQAAGKTTLPIALVDFSDEQVGLGTALENLSREDLNVVEKGKLFLLLRKQRNVSQERLAEELGEDVSRNQIKECEAAASSAPDIQEMLIQSERGIRAAKYLRQLDIFDTQEPGRAARERAPIIKAFLHDELTTDGVRTMVQNVLRQNEKEENQASEEPSRAMAEKEQRPNQPSIPPTTIPNAEEKTLHQEGSQAQYKAQPVSHENIDRTEKVTTAVKRFDHYKRLLGSNVPSDAERVALEQLAQDIQIILKRH